MTFDSPEVGIFYKASPASRSSIQRQLQRIYLLSPCWCCSYISNCRTKPLWLMGLVQDFQRGDRFVSCLEHIYCRLVISTSSMINFVYLPFLFVYFFQLPVADWLG